MKYSPNKVKLIKKTDSGELVDISINSKDHLYWVNGLITHNTLNFQIGYGATKFGVAHKLYPDFQYMSQIKQKEALNEAQKLIDLWFEKAPSVKTWMDATVKSAREKMWVTNMFGRRRYLCFINSNYFAFKSSAEREGGNTPIQSTASDICSLAAVKVHELFSQYPEDDCRIVNIVHDNIISEILDDRLDFYRPKIEHIMAIEANILKSVKLDLDVSVTKKWTK